MKARLVRIGNSRGIRLPQLMIREAGLEYEVDVRVQGGAVVIRPTAQPRSGWAEAARKLQQRGENSQLDEPTPTEFDEKEWRWK